MFQSSKMILEIMFYTESKYNIKIDGGNSMVARQVA